MDVSRKYLNAGGTRLDFLVTESMEPPSYQCFNESVLGTSTESVDGLLVAENMKQFGTGAFVVLNRSCCKRMESASLGLWSVVIRFGLTISVHQGEQSYSCW